MRSLIHPGTHGLTCVEARPGGHAFVRWWRYPLASQALRPDGEPECAWDWFAALEMHGTTLWAFGSRGFPSMAEFRDILVAATLLGATTLRFEHRRSIHTFNLRKYLRDASAPAQGAGATKPLSLQNIMEADPNNMTIKARCSVVSARGEECYAEVGSNFNTEKEATDMLTEFPKKLESWAKDYNLVTGDPASGSAA